MINIKPQINDLLNEVPGVTVSYFYPEDFANLPHISYYEASNNEYLRTDGEEQLTDIAIQIDVWSKTSTSELALLVDSKLSSIGFKREFSGDLKDPSGLNHKSMRYRGIVDKDKKYVYQY